MADGIHIVRYPPEDLPRVRELAQGSLKYQFESLVKSAESLLANPPDTTGQRHLPLFQSYDEKKKTRGWDSYPPRYQYDPSGNFFHFSVRKKSEGSRGRM